MSNKGFLLNIFLFSATLFSPIAFLINILGGIIISTSSLLSIGAIAILWLLSFIISSFIIILKDQPPKLISKFKIFTCSCGFYALISVVVNLFVQIIASTTKASVNGLWNIFSIILIAVFSIIISILIIYFKPNKLLISSIVYFLVIGLFYYLLTVTIGGLATGNKLIIILSIYVACFALVLLIYSIIKHKKYKKEIESKPYQKQF